MYIASEKHSICRRSADLGFCAFSYLQIMSEYFVPNLQLFFPYTLAETCVDEHPWSHTRCTGAGEDWKHLGPQPWSTNVSCVHVGLVPRLYWYGNQTRQY